MNPKYLLAVISTALLLSIHPVSAADLSSQVKRDYAQHLHDLFDYFHRNPELSLMETETAARLAAELREAGFEVTEGVGGTGVVAILENGNGPLEKSKRQRKDQPRDNQGAHRIDPGIAPCSRLPAH